jgi:uncharacterized protein YjcR
MDVLRKRRTMVVTAAVTVIAASGALIGATLKSKQQISEQKVRLPLLSSP